MITLPAPTMTPIYDDLLRDNPNLMSEINWELVMLDSPPGTALMLRAPAAIEVRNKGLHRELTSRKWYDRFTWHRRN